MKPHSYLRSGSLLAAILVAAGCSSGGGSNSGNTVPLAQWPTITAIADQSVPQDSTSSPIMFTIADADSDLSTLTVKANSANTSLISQDGITLGGNGGSRSITISPSERMFGTTPITVTVTDPTGAYVTQTFNVNVTTMQVSMKDFTTSTVALDENTLPQSIAGMSFTQDADDPTSFDSLLTN